MSREALVLLVCCCDFRDGAEWLIPSKSLRNTVIRAFPGLFCILRMCAPRRAAAVVRPRERKKSADRRRRILISRLLIIRASVPRRKSPFPAYFKGFPAVSPLIPPYPAFLKYPVSPQQDTIKHIAIEGHCFFINADMVFTKEMYPKDLHCPQEIEQLSDIPCRGGSCVVDPYGHYVTQPVWDKEEIIYADLDMQQAIASRMEFDGVGHYARPDVLELRVHE